MKKKFQCRYLDLCLFITRNKSFRWLKSVLTDPLHIRKNTQKSKFLLSQAFKWEKNMFFRNPRDAIQNFCNALKKTS